MPNLPRGIRNNNPLNIRLTKINWQGKIPNSLNTDKSFEQFTHAKFGFRAAAMDLISDFNKGKNTIAKLISEFAPPNENNTNSYTKNVANSVGYGVNDPITSSAIRTILPAMLHRMHISENGKEYFKKAEIEGYLREFKLV